MKSTKSKEFREKIRLLERSLEMLSQSTDTGCCSLSLSQCHSLVEIGRNENLTLKELASIISLDTSTTSRAVDSLVKKGLVLRTPSKSDRRSISISLTEAGMELFHNIEHDMDNKFNSIFNKIDSNQQDTVLHSLDLILTALKK